MTTKTIWQSKIFWYNAIMGVLAVCAELTPILDILGTSDTAEMIRNAVIFVTVFGNIALRFVTSSAVTLR